MNLVSLPYMMRRRPRKVPYKEQSGFFRPDYGEYDLSHEEIVIYEEG